MKTQNLPNIKYVKKDEKKPLRLDSEVVISNIKKWIRDEKLKQLLK